jgi:hypothetical protein
LQETAKDSVGVLKAKITKVKHASYYADKFHGKRTAKWCYLTKQIQLIKSYHLAQKLKVTNAKW